MMIVVVGEMKMFANIQMCGKNYEDRVWTLQQAGTAHCTRPGGALTRATAAGDRGNMWSYAWELELLVCCRPRKTPGHLAKT